MTKHTNEHCAPSLTGCDSQCGSKSGTGGTYWSHSGKGSRSKSGTGLFGRPRSFSMGRHRSSACSRRYYA